MSIRGTTVFRSIPVCKMGCQGIPNEVRVMAGSVAGLHGRVDNGQCRRQGDFFMVTPAWTGRCELVVYDGYKGAEGEVARKTFVVVAVPTPLATLNGKTGGFIGKGMLLAQSAIGLRLEYPENVAGFTVTEFSVLVNKDGFMRDLLSRSSQITTGQRSILQSLNKGEYAVFHSIRVRCPDGGMRDLPAMVFQIQ